MNHSSAVPQMPVKWSNRATRVLWSTVSKAAVRSNKTRITWSPESFARRMSLKALSKADSVLCRVLKPDWEISRTLCSSQNHFSWAWTTFSKILEIKGSLEMGLKLASTLPSRPGFLSRGWTTACFKLGGTTPEDRLLLMMARTDCPILGENYFKETRRDKIN